MEGKQNPFSVYDFLGYLIPGALFVYMLGFGAIVLGIHWPRYLPQPMWLIRQPDNYVPFAILAYIIGHLSSFVSSIFVERYAIWAFGYPSKFLLGIRPTSYLDGIPRDSHYPMRKFVRIVFSVINFPFCSLDHLFEYAFRVRELYAKELDPKTAQLIKRKIWLFLGHNLGVFRHIEKFENNAKGSYRWGNVDIFRAIYHYVIHNVESHTGSLKNYVAMYGLLRTLTFLFTSMFWVSVLKLCTFDSSIAESKIYNPQLVDKSLFVVCCVIAFWVLSYLFFMAFVKFYRRYSLEALMAFASNYEAEPPEGMRDRFAVEALGHREEILENLKRIRAAANQYMLENGLTQVSAEVLIGPDKLLPSVEAFDGEEYQSIVARSGVPISVRRRSGEVVTLHPNEC